MRMRWPTAMGLILALGCSGLKEAAEEAGKKAEEDYQKDLLVIEPFRQNVAQIAAQLPTPSEEMLAPCDPARIATFFQAKPAEYPGSSDWESFKHRIWVAVPEQLVPPAASAPPDQAPPYAWLGTSMWSTLHELPTTQEKWRQQQNAADIAKRVRVMPGFIVVVQVVESQQPELVSEGGMFTDGSFKSGYFGGVASAWTTASPPEKLCAVTFEASNSESVDVGSKEGEQDISKVIKQDFSDQVEKSFKAALKQIHPDLHY